MRDGELVGVESLSHTTSRTGPQVAVRLIGQGQVQGKTSLSDWNHAWPGDLDPPEYAHPPKDSTGTAIASWPMGSYPFQFSASDPTALQLPPLGLNWPPRRSPFPCPSPTRNIHGVGQTLPSAPIQPCPGRLGLADCVVYPGFAVTPNTIVNVIRTRFLLATNETRTSSSPLCSRGRSCGGPGPCSGSRPTIAQ